MQDHQDKRAFTVVERYEQKSVRYYFYSTLACRGNLGHRADAEEL